MWSHMRPALLHYTTNMDKNHQKEQQEAAHAHMLAYGRLAEQYFGPIIMTFKLHSIVCRWALARWFWSPLLMLEQICVG